MVAGCDRTDDFHTEDAISGNIGYFEGKMIIDALRIALNNHVNSEGWS
jgi:hypothetical protein